MSAGGCGCMACCIPLSPSSPPPPLSSQLIPVVFEQRRLCIGLLVPPRFEMTYRARICKRLSSLGINSNPSLCTYSGGIDTCAGILLQSMGARNQVGIGLSYRPARARIWKPFKEPRNRCLGIDSCLLTGSGYIRWRSGTTPRFLLGS